MKERTIFLDLDGMVVDLEKHIIQLHNQKFGTTWSKEDVGYTGDGEGLLRDDQGQLALLSDWLNSDHIFLNLDPLDGAVEAVEALKEIGDLHIASAPSRNKDSASDKIHWVEDKLKINRKKIALLKAKWHLRGDVFLEDWPGNLRNIRATNPTAFLGAIAYPHNAQVEGIIDLRARGHLNTRKAWEELVVGVEKHFRRDG